MTESIELKVAALMTAPRHEITFARSYIEIALRQAGVPLTVSGGVFYGQCMQRMLEDALSKGVDVAICIDFDSMFSAEDVKRLLRKLIEGELDALAALQCRRGKRFPLLTIDGGGAKEVTDAPFQVSTAHFGLTAIDLSKLSTVQKPWFFSKPDKNGQWSDDKIDDDIWFWQQWREGGNAVHIDPETKIGHLEEMVVLMDDEMNPQHLYPHEWAAKVYNPPKREGVLVFVGANVGGEEIETLCQLHERSILFEPLPDAAKKLRETVGKLPGVEVVQMACGEYCETATLNIYNELGLSSSLGTMTDQARETYSDFDLEKRGELTVDVVNLASWLKANEIDEIKTLFIDAQGMDLAILKTLQPMIASGRIATIQCEADSLGFKHYHGLPPNGEPEFYELMNAFEHYEPTRRAGRLEFQPDLVWKLKEGELCEA